MDGRVRYQKRHRELGLCERCSRESLPNSVLCALHLHNARISGRKHYAWNKENIKRRIYARQAQYRSEGRCIFCGVASEDRVLCVNCQTAGIDRR